MIKITLKSLEIRNFKGIRELNIPFSGQNADILGANASGKSSIMDAFTWLITGKDSQDRKDFDLKNSVDKELNRQDHEVTGVLTIDGRDETLKHVYRERWTKRQGSQTSEMTGHEHLYFWNDVPMQAGEYKAKVDNILQEKVFKLLTNALYFNSLNWTDRRAIVSELAGPISNQDIIDKLLGDKNEGDFNGLLAVLNTGKTIEEYKKEIVSKKKLLVTSLEEIAPRIDENIKRIPEEMDYSQVEARIQVLNNELAAIDTLMLDRNKANQNKLDAVRGIQTILHELMTERSNIEHSARTTIQSTDHEKSSKESSARMLVDKLRTTLSSQNDLIGTLTKDGEIMKVQIDDLIAGWNKDKARVFEYDESKFACPTCNRDFESDNIEEAKKVMKYNFDDETARLLGIVNDKGLKLKADKAKNAEAIQVLKDQVVALEKDLATAESNYKQYENSHVPATLAEILSTHEDYQSVQAKIIKIQNHLAAEPETSVNVDDLKNQKLPINTEIDSLKNRLVIRDQIKVTQQRIETLKAEESELSSQLASMEGIEFTIDEFIKAKISVVEDRTNDKFKFVEFKMFNTLINGGYEPTCVTMYKGVPWDTLNTAARINAGLDIINTLSLFYGFTAPIFLDNRESTTHIIETKSQVVSLKVNPEHEVLVVELYENHI